jgi:hypothetical protein
MPQAPKPISENYPPVRPKVRVLMVRSVAEGRAARGMLLLASGLVHVAVWAVLGGPWEWPVTVPWPPEKQGAILH